MIDRNAHEAFDRERLKTRQVTWLIRTYKHGTKTEKLKT
jgi:hypothetical protein